MANTVRIDIEANTNQAKSAFSSLQANLLSINAAVQIGQTVVQGLSDAYEQTIGAMVNTRVAMKDTADTIGVSVEDFSRLSEVADDNRVSQEQLTQAMLLAVKNGYQPSIQGLASLADKLQGMDATERAAMLSDTFGKSWKNVYKILQDGGQALIDNTAAVQDGLVVTDEAAKSAEKLWQTQDNLADSITNLKNKAIAPYIPAATRVVDLQITGIEVAERYGAAWTHMSQRQQGAAIVAAQAGKDLLQFNSSMDVGAKKIETTTHALWNAKSGFDALPPAMQAYIQNGAQTVTISSGIADQMSLIASHVSEATRANLTFGGAINDLKSATDNLKATQDGWNKTTGEDIKNQLEQAGLKGASLTKALQGIDQQMGTNFTQQQAYKDNIKLLVDQYARSKDADAFAVGVGKIKDSFSGQDEAIIKARVAVQDYKAALDILVSKNYDVWVNTHGVTSIPGTDGGGGGGGGNNGSNAPAGLPGGPLARANGGLVYPGGDYTVGENGIERLRMGANGVGVVTPMTTNHMGGVTIIVNGAQSPYATGQAVKRALTNGAKYSGG